MIEIQTLEPSFCPLHGQDAPCLYCLGPQVVELIRERRKRTTHLTEGILFQRADLEEN